MHQGLVILEPVDYAPPSQLHASFAMITMYQMVPRPSEIVSAEVHLTVSLVSLIIHRSKGVTDQPKSSITKFIHSYQANEIQQHQL